MKDHSLRYQLSNELHARPFPTLKSPCEAVFLAIKRSENAAGRDRSGDLEHLKVLLDRYGASHPKEGATHWSGSIGKHQMKWEQHTEFVTYTIFIDGLAGTPFDPARFDLFPKDWLDQAPGVRMTSALVRVETGLDPKKIKSQLSEWFIPESLAVSQVLGGDAVIATDFRIDMAGHMRLAMFAGEATGQRRIGRIVQRLCEIETYKSMSMLGFARARSLGGQLSELDKTLSRLMADMTNTSNGNTPDKTLIGLLETSAELENLAAKSSFRFAATRAYEAIVNQRIEVLREERFEGGQTFAEFMMRRFDPAMRTVKSSERQLETMAQRAMRAGDLLRTQVDVERSAQNQELLASMDKRADLQLRLQKTVEGLSVVAISYYAVNLVINMIGPLGIVADLSKVTLTAIATPIVILAVWWMVRRIRKAMD